MQYPKITVLTVVFNGAGQIRKTIDSVLDQRYRNVEYIVVDGGSTDGTREIIEGCKEGISRWVSEPDDGIYDAMNKGILLASGDVVNILNCGDYYPREGVLADVAEAFRKSPNPAWVCSRTEVVLDYASSELSDLNTLSYLTDIGISPYMDVSHQGLFYKRSLHEEFGLYDLCYQSASDHDFMMKLHKHGTKGAALPMVSAVRVKDEKSASSSLRHSREMKAIEDKHLSRNLRNEWRYFKKALKEKKNTRLGRVLWGAYLRWKRERRRFM